MVKKFFAVIMASLTVFALAASVFAYSFSYRTEIYNYTSTSRSYRAITKVSAGGKVDIITAGLKCLRLDNGNAVGEDFWSEKNATEAEAFASVPYNPYGMSVRGFGSHSAYKNGQTLLYEFTQTANVA